MSNPPWGTDRPPINVSVADTILNTPKTQSELQAAVLYGISTKQIWLDGYACIRPTDEFLKHLGASVLSLLNNPAHTLPALDIRNNDAGSPLTQAQLDTQALYLRILKS